MFEKVFRSTNFHIFDYVFLVGGSWRYLISLKPVFAQNVRNFNTRARDEKVNFYDQPKHVS